MAEVNAEKEINKRSEKYEEQSFLDKCSKYALTLGESSLRQIFNLYYALDSDKCTSGDKAVIYGALAYLVSPIDVIPDLTPFLGFSDDIAVIGWALVRVAGCVDDEVKRRTNKKLKEWFS